MTHYNTIEKEAVAEYKDRGSHFLAYTFPIVTTEDFKKRLKALRDENPKAAHHCFAYRIGLGGNNFRASDDGEPSGSAGKPILGVLDSKMLINTAIVVVRYFGGTLLGVPGLINAYKTVASFALQLTPIVQKPVLVNYELNFDYTLMNDVQTLIKRFGCLVVSSEAQLFCRMIIAIPKMVEEDCVHRLKEMYGVDVESVNNVG